MDALIFNIQRFSTHDGPGIRTTVFFKGCPLRCCWCHNPESQGFAPEIMHNPERCVLCGRCASVCPEGAVSFSGGKITTDREKCAACGLCAEECPACARELAGQHRSVDEILDIIRRDRTFYGESGGGATFSGGECLSQLGPLAELLAGCRRLGVSAAVDTCGAAPWEAIEAVAPLTDLWLYDIKCVDGEKHKALTGAGNELILANLHRLKEGGARIWLRLPLIGGLNDTAADVSAALALAGDIKPEKVSLLPYHSTGSFKYGRLGREAEDFAAPTKERLDEIKEIFVAAGHKTAVGA